MKNSIVVAASRNYEPGLSAFLNSCFYYNSWIDSIYILSLELSEGFKEKYRDRVKFVDTGWVKNSPPWSTKIPRFKFAAGLEGIVMLADADMFFCASMRNYFRIAETGLIVAGANGSNFRFHEGWKGKYKLDIPYMFDYKTITSVPTIVDVEKYRDIWLRLYDHKMGGGEGADFDLQNIFLAIYGKIEDIIVIPSQQVTGVHHFMLKPDTRVIRKEGKLMTNDGLEVLMVHGKWWEEGWYENLMTRMERYCKGDKACVNGAIQSRGILKEEFEKWRNK